MADNLVLAIAFAAALTAGGGALLTRRGRSTVRTPNVPGAGSQCPDGAETRAILGERRRIASEMHDNVLQLLTSALCSLRLSEKLLERQHPASQALADGVHLAQSAADAIRKAIFPLKSGAPVSHMLSARVHDVIRRLPHHDPISVHLAPLPNLSEVPAVEEAVAGILGEALTNAGKHAGARNVWAEVAVGQDGVSVLVRDDGIGFDLETTERQAPDRHTLGLHLMRERARAVGGRVAIASHRNAGTTVHASIPLTQPVERLPVEGPQVRVNAGITH